MRLGFLVIILILPVLAFGQLFSNSDYYVHEALTINPAYAGSQEALSATVTHRRYFADFGGIPTTSSVSIHTPLNNERIGLGLVILHDQVGISKETNIVGNYAYRIDLGYGKVSLGLGLALSNYNTNWNHLKARDANDELLADTRTSGVLPNFSMGVYYSTQKFFAGFSIPLFISHQYNNDQGKYIGVNDPKNYNYFFNAGIILNVGSKVKIYPTILAKYHQLNPLQLDIMSQVIFNDKIWIGGGWRTQKNANLVFQYQVNNQLRLAYSYSFETGTQHRLFRNSQEIMLNYVFNFSALVPNPRQF